MRKRDEISDPNSCFNRAKDDEIVFVVLGRDEAAPATIRGWVGERLRRGKNALGDRQILEALDCANQIERERAI